MDARKLEVYVEQRLKRLLGRGVTITRGPARFPVLGGMRPEVFLHAASLEDFGGVADDGTRAAREPVKGPSTFRGFVEARPGRVAFIVTCTTGSHDGTQELAGTVSPAVLLALAQSPPVLLGGLKDGSTTIGLVNYLPSLHGAESTLLREDELSCFCTRLVYHLDGLIQVRVSKRGGLGSATRKKRRAVKKSATKKKAATRSARKKTPTKTRSRKGASARKSRARKKSG